MKKFIILISILSVLYSCEKTINVKIPDNGRKLVLQCIYYSDSLVVTDLSKSRHIMDPAYSFESIENANVFLYENGQLVGTGLENLPGKYSFDYRIIAGNQYKIEANAEGLESVSCESTAPLPVKIDQIDISYHTIENPESPAYIDKINFDIKFNDDVNQKNFYMLHVATKYQVCYYDPATEQDICYENFYPISFETNEPSTYVDVPLFNNYGTSAIIFDDVVFNGKLHSFKIHTSDLYLNESVSISDVKFYFYFRSVNKELYNYYLSMAKYQDAEDNPFVEPVQVYSNINNGLGIFGGSTLSVDSLVLNMDEVFGNN